MPERTTPRWVEDSDNPSLLRADLLTSPMTPVVDLAEGVVCLGGHQLSPDAARMLGIWLVDAATRADGDRAIRRPPTTH